MNLLITGGLGYIGFEVLAAAARQPGARVVTFSRSPLPSSLRLPENAQHEIGSVLDEERVRQVLEGQQISHIVHAAGAKTSECASDPLLALESNVLGTDTLFRAARSAKSVRSIVFVSTAAVYGAAAEPVDESHPIAPATNYAVAKAAAELAARGHTRGASFQTRIVRPGFVIGPSSSGIRSEAKLNTFIRQARVQRELELPFAGRFFVHLAFDLGAKIVDLLRSETEPAEDTFHLPGHAVTIEEFASALRAVAEEFGDPPAIRTHIDPAPKVPAHLDFSHFTKAMNPEPSPDLKTMIRSVIEDGQL